jgi:hypothetical protein
MTVTYKRECLAPYLQKLYGNDVPPPPQLRIPMRFSWLKLFFFEFNIKLLHFVTEVRLQNWILHDSAV